MLINDLQQEQDLLKNTLKNHIKELCAPDNPQGILLCQKHSRSIRWKMRFLQDGLPVTVPLRKSAKELAEKLAVNLYRLVCILYIQKFLSYTDNMIRMCHREFGLGSSDKQNADYMPSPAGLQGDRRIANQNSYIDFWAEDSLLALLKNLRSLPETPADFFQSTSPYKPLLLSHLSKKYASIIDWYLGDFQQNPEHPEHLLFPVKLGFKVRSKSEMMAADRLYEEGILFHYEELIQLSSKDVYSDFFIPMTYAEKYVWEHNGAMDNENYFYRAKGKIQSYLNDHWFPGINMITTYETRQHPLTEDRIEQQIRWLKARYRLAFPDLPPDESFNMYDLATYVKISRMQK